jgi:hypothetical protein|tara:strand:- start:11589 stop:12044 length:456 start_codon:yes stop_codon:yes gene_type:complete
VGAQLRERVPDVLTPDEASELGSEIGYRDWDEPLIARLVDLVQAAVPALTAPPAYCRVERRPEGHPWHHDVGAKGHMAWCRYTAGCVLTPREAYSGGGFYFRDQPDVASHHYCDLVFYDDAPENEHTVARHRGDRRVLLMFFTGADEGLDV